MGVALIVQRRIEPHDLRRDPGEPARAALARAGAGLDHLVEGCIEGDAVGRLLHFAAQALRDVLLVQEEHHAVFTRPPLERAEMAPGKEAKTRGGEHRLGRDVARDAGKGVGARVRLSRVGDDRAAAGDVGERMRPAETADRPTRLGWQA